MVAEGEQTDSNSSFLRAARAGNLDKVLEWLKNSIDINTSNANGLNALHLASKEGHINVVTELIKRGANVNAATKKGNTALHISSLAGKQEVVKILVQNGANVNVQSQNGFTPLYMAAQENHDDVLSFLLANGANQSLATEDGFTPLAVALQQGHDKVVALLLENDTKGKVRLPALHIAAKKDDCKAAALLLQSDHNPDVTSKSGFTPLHIAAHYGNENIAIILLEKGADVNYMAKHQITPLHVAAKWGKSNMVALLLDKGAKINASTRDGLTPLHCAARSGHETVVDQLLENGAPIIAKTKNGLAPLHMSSQGDHVDSARILLNHKAPVDDITVDYLTALHVAAHYGHVNVAKLLLDRNADPNARALNGFTPLHIACKKNRIKVVELLLKHDASIEATTESGLTPLHVASFMGCMNIVIFLLQNGANPDVPTIRGETPLHLAARASQTDIIRILLRNGAHVDAPAREEQTPLHIAARLGNVDIVSLLLQHGATVDATTKDMYTALHVAAKEGQEEVASVLLDHGASLTAATKKGLTPLHMAAKYGNIKVARLLLHKDAPVDAQGKNGVTPLHVAAHYDHINVALLLLDKGASPHATAKNGYTPLHIASKKNQMDIATTLLEYGAKANAESKAGFTSLHLAAQEGHTDMAALLIEHKADVNAKAKNGLTPLHLCAQEDKVNVATILVKNGAEIDPQTKAEYSPLHVACHFGQINMVKFLLEHGANVNSITSHGYTPLHQAAQQGHSLIINLLLENQASPNIISSQGQTPLSIAQRLGYISVVETLKVVTETVVTTTTTTTVEEKYKVVSPETMQETFMSDSEDEGGEDTMLGDQSYKYLTADEVKSLGDDSLPIDVTKDEKPTDSMILSKESAAPLTIEEDHLSPQHSQMLESILCDTYSPDNIDISLTSTAPIHAGRLKWKMFLVSFMVDARGGAMRGCRHSGVRVIIPPRKAPMPMRITCRYLRKEKLAHPPPLMEGEACASRILEVGPIGARFLGPVIIEVPHFASLRGKEREITILRSDNGETWREHTLEASEEAVQEVLNDSFEGEELSALEDLNTNRITRILTTDFPQYFAIITRIRQEVHTIGPEGGMVSSTVVPQVQAVFPEGALTKKIKVGLQAQPIQSDLVTKLLGNSVAVSPIVTVEPRRRKFHKPITLTIPVPQAATKGMINQYSGDAPTLRLLCSITGSSKSGGPSKAQWEDVTGSTPLTFINECISFTTTVSARFWLMDCRQVNEATKFATELYQEAIHVPFMGKFVVFAKRHDIFEAQLRVFCMTDDKEDKTLESQEHFAEIAKSRDVEVLQNKPQYLEFAGNLVPITKSGDQLFLTFHAFRENRLPFSIRIKDSLQEPMGRIAFMKEPKVGRGEPQPIPICNLNIALPDICKMDNVSELVTLEKKYGFVQETGLAKPELIHRADLRLSDIARELDNDWVALALQLDITEIEINSIKTDYSDDICQQALIMLRHWMQKSGPKATGNSLEKALRKINRDDIVKQCMFNVELVTDAVEKAVAKVHLDQSGFETFKEELGPSRDTSLKMEVSHDVSYNEQDLMKKTDKIFENELEHLEKQISNETFAKEFVIQSDLITSEYKQEKDVKYISAEITEPQEIIGDDIIKQAVTTITSTTVVMDGEELSEHDIQDNTAKLVESETWASEMDTSQVSISSLPEDEKSEPTTATISSSIAAEPESATAEASAEEKEHELEKPVIPSDQDDSSSQDHTIEEKVFVSEKNNAKNLINDTSVSHLTKESLELVLDKVFVEDLKDIKGQKKILSNQEITKYNVPISTDIDNDYKKKETREKIDSDIKQTEKSPQHVKQTEKSPQQVDRGLSPIAVYTAYPGDIRREGSEFFVKTYDAPTMQEPTTSYLGKSIKENANRSRSISAVNKDFQPLEIILDRKVVDTEEGRATSESKLTLMNPSVAKTLDIHFKTESHIRITCRTKDTISPEQIPFNIEKGLASEIEDLPVMPVFQTDQALSPINIESTFKTEVVKSPSLTEEDISKGIGLQESFELSEEIFEKSEIATSPMSDHLLDTGVGTESPVTTETASSPFQLETKSVAVSPHDSATDMSFPKEDSSTQTTLVDTVSAHTSPIDLSLSFQEALLDQQIQLSMTGFESQDEIDTPEKEILEDEEVDDKLIQGHVSEIQEKELLLKSETISDQTSLKIFEQCDEKLTRDFKSVIDKESESFSFKKDITKQKPSDNDENMKKELIMKSDYSFQSAENFPKQYKSLQILESNKKSKSFMNDIIEDEKLTTDKSFKEQIDVSKKDEIVSASFIKEEKITTEWSKTEEKVKQLSMKTESGTSKEIESSLTSEGTIHRTREIDFSTEMEGLELNEIEMKQLTPEEILSFAEKRDFFQRLSQTSNLLPPDFSSSTKVTMIKGVKLFDENDTRKGEVVEEQVSFAERLKFFQAGAEDENSSKHSSVMDDSSAFSDEGTEEAERSITEKEFAEAKICGLEEKSSSSSDFIPEKQVLKTEIQLFLKTGLGGEAIEISKIKDYSGFRKESLKEQIFFSEEDKPEILENDSFEYSEKENEISEDWEIINDDEIKEARESLDLICTDKETEETWETSSKQKLKLKEKYGEKFTKKISGAAKDIDFVQGKYKQDIESFKPELDDSINKLKDIERTDVGTIYKTEMSYIQKDKIPFEENDEQFKNETNVERKEWKILSPQEIREVYEENGIKKTVTKIITKSVERATIQTVTDKFESDLKSMKELESSQEAFTESILTEMQLLDSLSEENEVIEKGTTIEETVEIPIEEFKSKEQDKIYSLIKPETNKILDISPIITEKKHSITEELLKMKTSLIHDSTLDSQTVQNIISSENKLEYNENEKCKTQIDLIRMEQKENTYKLIPETCSKSYSDTLNDQDIKDESIKIIENIYEKKPLLKLEEICRTKKEKELENKEGRIKDEIIVSSSVNEFSEDIIQEEMKEKLKTVLPAEEMSKSSNETEELVKISNMKEDIETCENVHIAFSDDSTLYDMIQSKITPLSPEINKICTDKKSSFLKEKNIICLENSHISHLETAELADSEQSIVKEEKPQEILLDDEIFTTNITSTIVTEGNDISTAEESTVIVRKISTIINKSKNVILEDEDYIKSKPDFSLEEHLFQISDKDISPEQSGTYEIKDRKEEIKDQFEVSVKEFEQKETAEPVEQTIEAVYISPTDSEFQKEEGKCIYSQKEDPISQFYETQIKDEIKDKNETKDQHETSIKETIQSKSIEPIEQTREAIYTESSKETEYFQSETGFESDMISNKSLLDEKQCKKVSEIIAETKTIKEQSPLDNLFAIQELKVDDLGNIIQQKAEITEFIEPLSETKETEEIQYSKSLLSKVADETELLSDERKKKSVEELIQSESETRQYTKDISLDKLKIEKSELQEQPSITEIIVSETVEDECEEQIEKERQDKKKSMTESSDQIFIDVSDIENIEPDLESKTQPVITTPVTERKYKIDGTLRKSHIPVCDVTGKYTGPEVKHVEPIILEPNDYDKETLTIDRHHSTPDFRQMAGSDLEAILEEHAKEEQFRAVSESADVEVQALVEPKGFSIDADSSFPQPSSPKLDGFVDELESSCAVEYSSNFTVHEDSYIDVGLSSPKTQSFEDLKKQTMQQKLINDKNDEYSDQEVFYSEMPLSIQTSTEISNANLSCESDSEVQVQCRTQMAFDNTAFMGIDNIDICDTINREMARSPYEVVRMNLEDFYVETEQLSLSTVKSVNEEQISNSDVSQSLENKYLTESENKEIPSREEATKLAQEIIEEIKTEVAKRPLFQSISTEISDEDLVEIDSIRSSSDEIEIVDANLLKLNTTLQNDKDENLIFDKQSSPALLEVEHINKAIEKTETLITKAEKVTKSNNKIKEYIKDPLKFTPEFSLYSHEESKETEETQIFTIDDDIKATSFVDDHFVTSEAAEIDMKDFHSQIPDVKQKQKYQLKDDDTYQNITIESGKEIEPFLTHAKLNGPVAVNYIPEYDDETLAIEKLKKNDEFETEHVIIETDKNNSAPISEKAELKQKISKTILVCSKKIEKEDQKSISIKNIKETEIFTEEEYTPVRISISDDQVDQEIKKILSEESQTDDDRLIDIIERPLTPEPSDEILDEVLLPESDQSSSLTTTTKKNILISEEKSFVEKAIIESEKIFCHRNLYEELESDRSSSILVNRFFETSAIDIESGDKNFSTESVFQQECADITEEAMDIGSDKCSDDIEESDKAHFELGVHFAAEPHYDEIPKYVESGYGDLYTHQEEDEEIFDDEMQGPKNLIENHKQILSDLDVLLGPKLYSKSGEHDDSSMSSLQEFERLEAEIAIGRKLSQGSVDSLNGRPPISKSGEHDDVSMNSLTEFERLERECAEAERIESVAREEAARLSEIEEGHESQASEASQETLSGPEDMDSIDSDDYEKRLSEIDEIIRQAQTNVENFQVESIAKQNLKSIKTLEKKSLNENTENDTIDLISSSSLKEQDNDSLDGNLNNVLPLKKDSRDDQDSLEMNATELKIEIPTSTVVSHDVTDDSLNEDQDNSIEHDSLLETKGHEQDSLKEDKIGDVDSLQGDQKMLMQDSLYEEKDLDDDSLHESIELPKDDIDELQLSDLNKDIDVMEFDDSLHEECDSNDKHLEYEHRLAPSMISSTDSLEPSSSTATHATYQFETDSIMSSSLNSIQTSGEETLMISSTDSLEPYRYIAADSKLCREIQDMYLDSEGNVKSNSAQAKSYIDKEGNIHPLTEIMKKLDFMKNTCVLNMVEKDKITVESIESKAIKDLINHDLSSEYISQDTSETEMKTVIKDLPPPLISEDSLDDNFDEEGNIIKKSEHSENSKSEYHSSNMLDSTLKLKEKEKESISTNENLEKQLESEFCGSKIIQSTKPGEQVEEIRTVDEYGNIRIIRRIRHIVTVQRDELNNSDIGKNDISDPEVEETRTTDEKGNVKIIRRTKRIIKMSDSQSSDIDKHFREFVQKSSVSDDSQITSPDVSQADSLREKYFQDPRCESPVTRELIMSGRESVASIRSDFSDADSEIKEVRTTDEKGNIIIRRIKRIVTPLPPDSNPPSGRGSPYLKEPGETVEEKQTIDEKGNVIIKRIRRIVKVHPKDISETSIIPTIDNEIVSKSSENIYVESEPDEYKTDDDDGNLKISRRISKVIKMPEISNNDDTFCNIAKCDDEMKESDIKNELDEKLMTEKVLIHVKKLSPTDESNKEQQQQKNVEERLKEFLKTTIVGNSKDETQVKEEKMTDDKGNIVICRTVENFKVSEPLIHCQKFTGPDAEKQSFEFVKSFEDIQSKENLHQFEATDDEGNAICVTQEMSAQPHIHSVSFSGENYEEEMEKYMKNYKKEEIYSSQPKSSSSHNKDSSFTSINIPHSTIKISFHDVDKSSHKTPTEMFSPPVMPSTHQEERSRTELMPDHVDNRTLVQIFDSDDAIDSEEDEVIDYLKPSSSSYKDVETPSDEKKECLESSAKQL